MPELPEVETVRRGLEKLFPKPVKIKAIRVGNKSLREEVKASNVKCLKGQRLRSFGRRAKYLLLETDDFMIISHLGMTGSWRIFEKSKARIHDHIFIHLDSGKSLVYNDPRRFGLFKVVQKEKWQDSPQFKNLGPEPFDRQNFKGKFLYEKSRGRKASIKAFLMDQKTVVGIGNIYASEVLFLSSVRPNCPVNSLSLKDFDRIVSSSRQVLRAAMSAGGTTIRDFRQAGGSKGAFSAQLLVYDRESENCYRCGNQILQAQIVGRSSYWCPQCQK
ncbi:MAG: bifunctional DNA-formamidopyrimidine glycosylase/DNA-(apurinic or apyrimidinic site) lyase [Bdellovibrionales bacterium]|nr:bifunctional DNA-formamidopyrimidine glycosylase/DNA-(apurinic or apyrimidinic site) lyase [Bdellovibrionales bacterium]